MNTRQFRYKELFFLTYLVFAISFFIPAYAGESMSFCCGGIEIWPGWKCALAVFAVIFNEKFLLGILWSLPNIFMIFLIFAHKRIGLTFIITILIISILSCSYWSVNALVTNSMHDLLPGYWLWYLSIATNNFILFFGKRKAG